MHVVGRKRRGPVNDYIRVERHVPELNLSADRMQFLAAVLDGIGNIRAQPFGEIHLSAPMIDMVHYVPGDWRNVRVPRPDRVIGVTIPAGSNQYAFDRWRNLNGCCKCTSFDCGRVDSRGVGELYGSDQKGKAEQRAG